MSTPTPLTDKAAWKNEGNGPDELCDAEHARLLETEIAAALEREKALRELLQVLDNELSIQPPPRPGEYHWPRAHKIVKQALALCTEGKTKLA